jgi:hypothetical protein
VNRSTACSSAPSRGTIAAELCAASCGTSGDVERERCAVLGRDCADVGRPAAALLLRNSPNTAAVCALHAATCDAFADCCAKWRKKACCKAAMLAARECATACRQLVWTEEAA